MSIKAQLEALIYAAEEPITLDQMAALLKDELLALKNAPPAEAQAPASALEAQPESGQTPPSPEGDRLSQPEGEQPSQPEGGQGHPLPAEPEQAENHLGAVEDAGVNPPALPGKEARRGKEKSEKAELRGLLRPFLDELIADYAGENHGIEVREV